MDVFPSYSKSRRNSKPLDFSEFMPTTYSIEKQLQVYNLDESSVSRNSQLAFIRVKGTYFYYVLDLQYATINELHLDLVEFENFNEFRLLSLNDPNTVLMISRLTPDLDHFWSYQFARFQIDFLNKKFKRIDEWSEVAKSFEDSGSCFVTDQKLYLLFETIEHQLKMQTFDIELRKLDEEEAIFTGRYANEIWNVFECRFRTYSQGFIYSFRCFRDPSDCTFNYGELCGCFNQIIRRKVESGGIEYKFLRNDLKCLDIKREAYDRCSSFSVDGLWLGRKFHLTVRIEDPPATSNPSNYFAMLDLDSNLWRAILVDRMSGKPHHPIKIVITNVEKLIFLRPFSTYKDDGRKKRAEIVDGEGERHDHHLDIYRIPLRKPEPLKTICTNEFQRAYGHKSRVFNHFRTILVHSLI